MQCVQWSTLSAKEQQALLQRPQLENSATLQKTVQTIIDQVRRDGDRALYQLTQQFDKVALSALTITRTAIDEAAQTVDGDTIDAMTLAIARIRHYHTQCLPQETCIDNAPVTCQRLFRPIERVGLYVPGGSAPLISTLMMIAIPAQIAGCPIRVLCTPPGRDGRVDARLLLAAKLCGIETVYSIGGAQAIAAMAYGTETVPAVNKLFGPGNRWVMAAKLAVSQDPQGASIDLPAGPSEVVVVADKRAQPVFVAADLLSQAEHGRDSQVILLTDDRAFAAAVITEIERQLPALSRCDIARQSLQHGRIILTDTLEQAITISNRYAPEHLILQISRARDYLPQVMCAGTVFIGDYTPEALGDYISGSNHVLPTCGYASRCNGLSVEDYLVAINVQETDSTGLQQLAAATMMLADIEGLDAHRQAVALRLKHLSAVKISCPEGESS